MSAHTENRLQGTLLMKTSGQWPATVWAVALYDPTSDPWSVRLLAAGGPRWTLSRDLLRIGTAVPIGSGEVHVRPYPRSGREEVEIRHGETVFRTRRAPLEQFLLDTYAIAPRDTESRWVAVSALAAALQSLMNGTEKQPPPVACMNHPEWPADPAVAEFGPELCGDCARQAGPADPTGLPAHEFSSPTYAALADAIAAIREGLDQIREVA